MKKVYIYPQWQGGGERSTYDGAEELKGYLTGQDYVTLPVSTDEAEAGEKKQGIRGFDVLRRQMQSAYDRIRADSPDKLVTLGGGCDGDVPAIVYLCEACQGDLTLIWLDAHGDLNTPETSPSSLFYGMPLGAVMDPGCFGLLDNPRPLGGSQIIHIGGRDFDEAEKDFLKGSGMAVYSVQDIRGDGALIRRIAEGVPTGRVYVHLDLDVIDPGDFPHTPLPVEDGLRLGEVSEILAAFADKLVGLGVYEYAPSGTRDPFIHQLIRFGLAF